MVSKADELALQGRNEMVSAKKGEEYMIFIGGRLALTGTAKSLTKIVVAKGKASVASILETNDGR